MKSSNSLRILQISPQDVAGGAERVALDLHQLYTNRGIDARLLVRFKRTSIPNVYEANVFEGTSFLAAPLRFVDRCLSELPHFYGRDTLRVLLSNVAVPHRFYDQWRGADDWNYPYSTSLTKKPGWQPDVIHFHNLHTNYFDLSALPALGQTVPLVWTLHDTWPFTGHCAYFIDCNRWQAGCNMCPDLSRAPAVRKNHTHEDWLRKREIYAHSQLHVVCPSKWLMSQVEKSMLEPATKHIIPNGVNLNIFKRKDRQRARQELGLPQHSFVCLFVAASGACLNPYKDYQTIDRAIGLLFNQTPSDSVQFICMGGQGRLSDNLQSSKLFIGQINDPVRVALHYQAANVYIHAANADNFPCTILEAQACGIPVVATAVSGIPEQIEDGVTGYLVPRGDYVAIAERIRTLMGYHEVREAMGLRAAERAKRLFDLKHQVNTYLNLYTDLLTDRRNGKEKSFSM